MIKKKVEFEETEEVKVDETETDNVDITEEDNPAVVTEASDNEASETAETPEVVEDFADETPVEEGGNGEQDADTDPTSEDQTEPEEERQAVSAVEDEDSTGTRVENSLNYSVTIDGVKKDFAVSLADKINALTILVNDTYSESDNTYYYVLDDEDDPFFKEFITNVRNGSITYNNFDEQVGPLIKKHRSD